MINFQERFKGKMSYIPKHGLVSSPEKRNHIMQQDQSINRSPLKASLIESNHKDIYQYKLPPIKTKIVDRTQTLRVQPKQSTKKIYSADHSKINLKKYDDDIEEIQMKHLQYLNKIEQLYMNK